MGKSLNIVFIKQHKEDDEGVITVRTIENRTITKKSLGIKIKESEWHNYFNPKSQRFRENKKFPQYEIINNTISNFLDALNKFGNNLSALPNDKKSFLKYWKETLKNFDNHGSIIKHKTIIAKLEKYLTFINRNDLLFKDITPLFLRSLKNHLATVKDPKGLTENTLNHYLKVFKSIINQAIADDYYTYSKHPFSSFKFTNEKVKKNVLSEKELELLLNTKIENEELNKIRDMFLFQVFSNGMRVSDVLMLRWNVFVSGRLQYNMFKTGNHISIPVNINMALILSRIVGVFDKYKGLCEEYTTPFKNEFTFMPIKLTNISIPQLDEIINEMSYDPKKKVHRTLKLIQKPKEMMGEIITYKGYKVEINDEKLKRVIDTRENLLNQINGIFLSYVINKIKKNKKAEMNEFIFPALSNELFNNISESNDFTKLTIEQYKSIKHNTIVYNRRLKKIQELCGIETNLSSHVSRHTFTNLLLRMENVNLYDISQSLGHSSIKITESYLTSGFNVEKIDYLNKKISTNFTVQ